MFKHSIYVPSQSSKRVISDNERANVLSNVCDNMTLYFGGCTSIEAQGFWRDNSGAWVSEHITIVYAYSDYNDSANVLAMALELKRVLAQDSVLYTVSGDESVTFV
jgi:hypothetical protein